MAITYDFDTPVDRRETGSVKWQLVRDGIDPESWHVGNDCFEPNGIIPMWVADMDFRCPDEIVNALVERARHGVFGYTLATDDYRAAVCDWMRRRQGWAARPKWIVPTPGIVPALHWLVRAFTKPGEQVLVQPPVYYPFFNAAKASDRPLARNPLVRDGDHYHMNYEELERIAADPQVTLAILSNPHNPVGRVWQPEELRRFGEICTRHGVLVVADEIHGDLVLPGHTFTPYASLGDNLAALSIICTAPSKTFNLAGLQTSNIFIPDETLRERFSAEVRANGIFDPNPFGMVACQTAYTHGEAWLDQLLTYIEGNVDFLVDTLARTVPEITVIRPEGTYLAWLDCRALGITRPALEKLFLHDARVFLDEGRMFGPEGDGFERINLACPRSVLAEALSRIAAAAH
ncbi:cystathionine beta-lyase [Desulfobaculum xiamenense]|uniref:cysteine-S-conjugate beta-lyase n=1 Tax=Desulfobaculum xiamenense TaxID=995050 RepID=A0A846QKF5_9BACT|nr:cystathionine beta-lyase [Desulfobaculum xiamenense]